MVKVCHLTSAHSWNDIRIFQKQCKSLAKAGYDVHLIVPNCDKVESEGVKLHSFNFTGGRFKRMRIATKKVYEIAKSLNADIYHFHDPELMKYGRALVASGAKVIYDIHEDLPRQILSKPYIPKFLRGAISKFVEKDENKSAAKFNYCITATPFIRDRFLKVNKNTLDINNYPLLDDLLEEEVTINSNRDKSVLYAGGITRIRGVKQMIEAVGKSKASTFHLAGKFASQELKTECEGLDGWGKVNYHGLLDRNALANLCTKSSLGLVLFWPEPNHINAQPNKLFEYMSAKLPIIASNFEFWKGVIEKCNTGICVDPFNTDHIADAINEVLDNKELATEMGLNGRAAVESTFNWNVEEEKLLKIYRNL